MIPTNLLDPLPSKTTDGQEIVDIILNHPHARLERIVSHGQASPEGFWYDQEVDEWVVVLQGHATLRFENPTRVIELTQGDHCFIPAHCRHRVERTATPTVWLALWVSVDIDAPY